MSCKRFFNSLAIFFIVYLVFAVLPINAAEAGATVDSAAAITSKNTMNDIVVNSAANEGKDLTEKNDSHTAVHNLSDAGAEKSSAGSMPVFTGEVHTAKSADMPYTLMYIILCSILILLIGLYIFIIVIESNKLKGQLDKLKQSQEDELKKISQMIERSELVFNNQHENMEKNGEKFRTEVYAKMDCIEIRQQEIEQLLNRMTFDESSNEGSQGEVNSISDAENSFDREIRNETMQKSEEEILIDEYNEMLSKKISASDFLSQYPPDIYINSYTDARRTVSFIESDVKGQIQVYRQSFNGEQYLIAVICPGEISSLGNSQTKHTMSNIFDFKGIWDFANKRIKCIKPAEIRKSDANKYEIVSKGVYSSY